MPNTTANIGSTTSNKRKRQDEEKVEAFHFLPCFKKVRANSNNTVAGTIESTQSPPKLSQRLLGNIK
ncbi:hypothetical protein FBU59_004661, partial [Linderina macrospora]